MPSCPLNRLFQLTFTTVNGGALSSTSLRVMWYCWLFLFCPPDEQKGECGCGLFDHWWNLLSFHIFTDWFYFFCEFTGQSFACFRIWLVVFSGRSVARLQIVEISTPLLSLYVVNIFPWSVLCFFVNGVLHHKAIFNFCVSDWFNFFFMVSVICDKHRRSLVISIL